MMARVVRATALSATVAIILFDLLCMIAPRFSLMIRG